ncbi:MAG: histidine kinase [Bacteroidota bacterium]
MLCFSAGVVAAQPPLDQRGIDSLVQLYETTGDDWQKQAQLGLELSRQFFRREEYELATKICRELLTLAAQHEIDSLAGKAYGNLMNIDAWTEEKNYELYADSAIYFLQRANRPLLLAKVYSNASYTLARRGRCERGIAYMETADSLYGDAQLPVSSLVKQRMRYCGVLQQCSMHERIPALAKEYIPLLQQEKDYDGLRLLYDFCFNSHGELGEIDSAEIYIKKCEAILPKINRVQGHYVFYVNAARAYMVAERFQQAYEMLQIAKSLYSPGRQDAALHYNLGQAALGTKRFRESARSFEIALNYFKSIDYAENISVTHQQLAEAYAELGDFQTAYAHWKAGDKLRDSLATAQHTERIEELTVQYETERVERELAVSELSLQQQITRNRWLLIVVAAGVFATLIIYAFLRARRRRKQLEYDKRQAELRYNLLRAQMNPHFIFNSLNSIQSFFSNQRFSQGNEFLGAFSQLVRKVLEQTGQKAISLTEELETLQLYLDLEKLRLGSVLNFAIHLDSSLESDLIRVPPLILQPFVENAIWHGIAPKSGTGKIDIFIEYNQQQDALHAIIEDDGVGIQVGKVNSENHRSRGVAITRERLGIGGKIDIRNRGEVHPGHHGVRTELIIPLWD